MTDLWEARPDPKANVVEARAFGSTWVRVTRRRLTYLEEVRIIGDCSRKGKPDYLEMLARAVPLTVQKSEQAPRRTEAERLEDVEEERWKPLAMDADRCRGLKDDADLAWFFINWLCDALAAHVTGQSLEDTRKKSGP